MTWVVLRRAMLKQTFPLDLSWLKSKTWFKTAAYIFTSTFCSPFQRPPAIATLVRVYTSRFRYLQTLWWFDLWSSQLLHLWDCFSLFCLSELWPDVSNGRLLWICTACCPLALRCFKDEFQTPFGLRLSFDLRVSLPCNTLHFPASEFFADSTVLCKPTTVAQVSVLGYKTGGCQPSTEFCGLVWALPYKHVLTYL